MKTMIIGLAILLNAVVVNASDSIQVSDKILKSFKKEFVNASDIYWSSLENNKVYRVNFIFQEHQTAAFFDEEGDLLRTIRLMSVDQLPVMVIKRLLSDYDKFTIKAAEEYNGDDMLYYVVTLGDEKKTVLVSFSPNGDIQSVKKIKFKNL